MGKHKKVICKICYRVMRSDNLDRHIKIHDKHVEVEPLSSVTSSDVIPLTGSNDVSYKLTNMDEEMLLKKC